MTCHDSDSIKFRYYGGNADLLSGKGLEEWQSTVLDDPWLFSGDLVPIASLIQNQTKRIEMERAVQNHLNKAALREYERIIQPILNKAIEQYPKEVDNFTQSIQVNITCF